MLKTLCDQHGKRPTLRRWAVAVAGGLFAAAGIATAPAAEGLSSNALAQIQSLIEEKASRTPVQRKLDAQLIYAAKQARGEPIAAGVSSLRTPVVFDAQNRAEVDIKATVSADLLGFISQMGGAVVNSHPRFSAVRAWLPLNQLEALASRSDVRFVQVAAKAELETGALTSEGDTTQAAIAARTAFGVDGSGVKVGVISDSVDFLAQSQATGDAPPVTVLPGQAGFGSGEGTAMIEIVHDLAPGAQIYFATANGGEASFAQNILDLRAAGCDVIVDDVRYSSEPPLQDGIIAQAVNSVTADGAIYFASAGNSGNKNDGTSGTWEGDFVDGGAVGSPANGRGGNLHSFGANAYNPATAMGGFVALYWADPQGASTNDYDLFVLDAAGNAVVSSSTTAQTGSQDPFEFTTGAVTGERVVVVKVSGDDRFLHIDSGRGELEINTDGFARGHSAASNAVSTAAVYAGTSYPNVFTGGAQNPVETFSSDGPRRIFFEQDGTPVTPGNFLSSGGYVRQYPVAAATDGVQTTVPGFDPFFGTSAAAPHGAAVAALVKSYNPSLTANEVRQILLRSALDIEAAGVDRDSGAGIIMALAALQAATPPLPLPRFVLGTNYIEGGNGNGVIDYNECNGFWLELTNSGFAEATGVEVTLSTTTPEVGFGVRRSAYPDIPVGGVASNLLPFSISTSPEFICGTPIMLNVQIKSDQVTTSRVLVLSTGATTNALRFDNSAAIAIPGGTIGTNSTITVSNILSAINHVSVALHITHPWVGGIAVELISPDGTTNLLTANHGFGGDNYGVGCEPDAFRTTFDDDALTPISSGIPPFMGAYQPDQPLAVFVGTSGTNVNGNWQLRVVDSGFWYAGVLQCWSLFLTPAVCEDGGGTCPGSDLAIGMADLPDPVFIGSNLVYTLSVTNFGPSPAKDVVVTHQLPPSTVYVSAISSQGNCVNANGTVICNLGNVGFAKVATITITVTPTAVGTISSTANVTSPASDNDLDNNTVTVTTRVNPPTADLALSLADAPDPALVGGTLTYTVNVVNNGPSPASFVTVTNLLPPSVAVQTVTPSQGFHSIFGNVVVLELGSLAAGAQAGATIVVRPSGEGPIVATATVRASQVDPVVANNTASTVTTVGPAADLGVSISDSPDPIVINSNLTYRVWVTNAGPNAASGVVLNSTLPAAFIILSTNTTQGTISIVGNNVICSVGNLPAAASALVTIVGRPNASGTLSASAVATGTQADPNGANNTAVATTSVAAPFLSILPAGATLTSESLMPPNGAVDVGETVTLQLRLRNAGNVSNTNLVATLLATGGVTPITSSQIYGVLLPGGLPVGRWFSFSANGTNGGVVTATLQLQDGPNSVGTASFVFPLAKVAAFTNANPVSIPGSGRAEPYPSTISVSGITGLVGKVTVTLSGLQHDFPDDLDILLVGPSGQKSVLMSDAGGGIKLAGDDLVFDDTATALPDEGPITAGMYGPADFEPGEVFESPAPLGPYANTLAAFNGANPNGDWSLFIMDDTAGDAGELVGGWQLSIATVEPVNQVADLILSAGAESQPSRVGYSLTNQFVITNAGPNNAASVAFTNVVPAGAQLLSASTSQGSAVVIDNTVFGSLGSLGVGATASVTVVVSPVSAGVLTNSATVSGSDTDLNLENNTVAVNNAVNLPLADAGIAQVFGAETVTLGSNVTCTLTLTNAGPDRALSVVVTDLLPAGVSFVSASLDVAGSVTNSANEVVARLGDLQPGGSATLTIQAIGANVGKWTNSASVATGSADTAAGNNTAAAIFEVALPAPKIIAASAALLQEEGTPNGAIDVGETVTVSLALENEGSADTASMVATLKSSGGVIPVGAGSQTYGVLVHGGAMVSRPFTFTASGAAGGVIVATLQLQDGVHNLADVTFTFNLPGASTFSSTNAISIPERGMATPYPSMIVVSGMTGLVSKVTVTLRELTHGFPDDLDVLLVGPTGQKVKLMSDAGGSHALTNVTLTLADAAASALTDAGQIVTGEFKPADYDTAADSFPGVTALGSPGSALVDFNGAEANGTWSLYVVDDSTGDGGRIIGGWSLSVTTITPLSAVADLALTLAGVPDSAYTSEVVTYTLSVTNHGPSAANGVVVSDTLPAGMSYISGTASQGGVSVAGNAVTCDLGSLQPSAGAGITIQVLPTSGGSYVNSASVIGVETDLNPANNASQVTTVIKVPAPARLTEFSWSDGKFQCLLLGEPGLTYVIQTSTNFTRWEPLLTNTAGANGSFKFTDDSAAAHTPHYYRAKRQTP